MNDYTAIMLPLKGASQRAIFDYSSHKGPELTQLYFSMNLFNSRDMNAAAMIGIPAIADIARLGLSLSRVMEGLTRVIYEGVIRLAMNAENWKFSGDRDGVAEAKAWIGEGRSNLRRCRIEQLLGIFQRPADRFIAINLRSESTTLSDIVAAFETRNERTTVLLDAFALADNVQHAQPGDLFSLTVNAA